MKVFVALTIGYVFGARTTGKDLEHVTRSLKALCETDEFADVVSATRSQIGNALRELAGVVDGTHGASGTSAASDGGGDLVSTVRHLVGHD